MTGVWSVWWVLVIVPNLVVAVLVIPADSTGVDVRTMCEVRAKEWLVGKEYTEMQMYETSQGAEGLCECILYEPRDC